MLNAREGGREEGFKEILKTQPMQEKCKNANKSNGVSPVQFLSVLLRIE